VTRTERYAVTGFFASCYSEWKRQRSTDQSRDRKTELKEEVDRVVFPEKTGTGRQSAPITSTSP